MRPPGRSTVLFAAGISWLGLLVHNVADLPDQYPWSPETSYPTIFLIISLVVWWLRPRVGAAFLIAWAGLHLIGGGLFSVLPLPVLPFEPEQTLRHYTFHVLYGLSQLPLLITSGRALVSGRAGGPRGGSRVRGS